MSIYLYMFDKDRVLFLVIAIVALGIPAYMIYKYGFMGYAEQKQERRQKRIQKMASATGLL
jgi:hypothetical protein